MDTEIKHKHPILKKYGLPALLAAALSGSAIWAWSVMGTSSYSTDLSGMTVGDVTSGSFNDYIRINGKVETGVTVQVSALETGIVESRLVEEGAMVNAGDVILTHRNPNLKQKILDSE